MPDLLVTEDKIAMDDYDRRRGEGLKLPEDDVALKCVRARAFSWRQAALLPT